MNKNIFLLLSIIVSSLSVQASKYLQTGLTWEIYLSYNRWGEYTLLRDTIMNEKTYFIHSEYSHSEHNGFYLRDDDTGLYAYFPRYDLETQLYSYQLSVGDSLVVTNEDFLKAHWGMIEPDWDGLLFGTFDPRKGLVTSIDTIMLQNGEPRRRIHYQDGSNQSWFIEGIGTAKGLLGANVNDESSMAEETLLCCHTKNAILWDNGHCPDVKSYVSCACELYDDKTPLTSSKTIPSASKKLINGQIVIETAEGRCYSILGMNL